MKTITNQLSKFIQKNFNLPKEGNSIHDQVENIKRSFDTIKPKEFSFENYYIIIHSMDAGQLKNEEW